VTVDVGDDVPVAVAMSVGVVVVVRDDVAVAVRVPVGIPVVVDDDVAVTVSVFVGVAVEGAVPLRKRLTTFWVIRRTVSNPLVKPVEVGRPVWVSIIRLGLARLTGSPAIGSTPTRTVPAATPGVRRLGRVDISLHPYATQVTPPGP
jgi:hypothetical protein